MKILHIALNYLGQRQNGMERMLQSLGDYVQFDWMAHGKNADMMLLKLTATYKPDLTFCQIHASDVFRPETIAQISGFKMSWCGDVREGVPDQFRTMGKAFDITLFSNMRDVEIMRSEGFNADYLQIGFNEEVYRPAPIPKVPGRIVFMANHYGAAFPNSDFRMNFVKHFQKEFKGFKVYGRNFPKAEDLNNLPGREAAIYASSIIGINISHAILPRYTSDRLHRLMGSGCFCLSQNYPGIELEFTPGIHLVTFETIQEAADLARFYLANPDQALVIQQQGTAHVHLNHSWLARAKDIMRIYETFRNGN